MTSDTDTRGPAAGTAPASEAMRQERGVSNLLGYILLTALLIGTTVLASIFGVASLLDVASSSGDDLGVSSMEKVQANINELASNAPYRSVDVDARDANLFYGNRYQIRIQATGGGVSLVGGDTVEIQGRELVYQYQEGVNVTYSAGLIASDQSTGAGALMRRAPDIEVTGSRTLISVPETYPLPSSSTYVGTESQTTIPVLLDRTDATGIQRTGTFANGTLTNMTGTITIRGTAVPGAWQEFFAEHDGFGPRTFTGVSGQSYGADTDGDGDIDVVGATFETERLLINSVEVGVGLNVRR